MADTFARMRQIAGSAAEWAANDIVLGDGEIGVERFGPGDTRIKIGNGSLKWSQLPYVANTVAAVDAQVAAAAVHASNADADANRAETAADNAAASEASATALTAFYLGGKAADPALRNNGSALQTGDLYYNTANDRMRVYETGIGWIDYEATAQTAATTATTQAGIATAQAATATTQATNAGISATNAANAKAAAELARDAAFTNANVYATVAAGLAATAVNGQFQVISGDVIIRYRVDAGPVATEVARFPASDYVFNRISDNLSGMSGYVFALSDDQGRAALAIEKSGNVTVPGSPAISATRNALNSLSGMAYGITDKDGRLAFGIDSAGRVVAKGVVVDLPTLTPLLGALDPTSVIDCWGDSLTQGNATGVTVPYPTALASLLPSRTIRNKGLSGRTSLQIGTAFGGIPSILTVNNNTIPASGAVNVTLTENGNLSSKTYFVSLNTVGSLYGIPGTLNVGYNNTDPALAGASTFTRTTAGSAIVIPNRVPFIPVTDNWENNTVVIWSGRNDIGSSYTDPTTYSNTFIINNIQAMIDFLKPLRKRFIILTVTDTSSEYAAAGGAGAVAFNQILALNYEISRRWPRNYIDVRKILVNSYNSGSAPDVTAFNRDQVPPSLQTDGLHLNDAGNAIVAQAVANFITSKGW